MKLRNLCEIMTDTILAKIVVTLCDLLLSHKLKAGS